jgi:hypothetical protein
VAAVRQRGEYRRRPNFEAQLFSHASSWPNATVLAVAVEAIVGAVSLGLA